MSRLVISISLSLLLAVTTHAQSRGTVDGLVIDAETGEVLPGAHVFLANTTIGDITDDRGFFAIQDIQAGTYQIIATIVGFRPLRKTIQFSPTDSKKDITFKLEKEVYDAGAITVTEKRYKPTRQRKRDLNRFYRMFLGTTPTRQDCEVENPHVIEFTKLSGFFEASSKVPIVIANKHLGYKLSYILDLFSTGQNLFRFAGQPFFIEMEPKDEQEAKRWEQRRALAYNGSFQHFLRSAAEGNLVKEGFDVYLNDSLYWQKPHRKLIDFFERHEADVKAADFINPHTLPHERVLAFSGFLHVFYSKETMHRDFYRTGMLNYSASKEPVRAVIHISDTAAVFNEVGFLNNPFDVARYGYWNWESGICNWLPFNYGLEPAG